MTGTFTYNKHEKLKSRKLLQQLFATARSFSVFPVKVFYMPLDEAVEKTVQVGVGVSARNFRKAVDRNRIKRVLRECYRLNKTVLHEAVNDKKKPLAVFILYLGKELPEYALLDEKMKLALTKLVSNIAWNRTYTAA